MEGWKGWDQKLFLPPSLSPWLNPTMGSQCQLPLLKKLKSITHWPTIPGPWPFLIPKEVPKLCCETCLRICITFIPLSFQLLYQALVLELNWYNYLKFCLIIQKLQI